MAVGQPGRRRRRARYRVGSALTGASRNGRGPVLAAVVIVTAVVMMVMVPVRTCRAGAAGTAIALLGELLLLLHLLLE